MRAPQPAQGVDQRSHRPLAQAGHAVEPPEAGDHGQGGHQEAEHGARVAAEDLDLAVQALPTGRQAHLVLLLLDLEAAAAEGGEEQAGVLGEERALDHQRLRPRAAPG